MILRSHTCMSRSQPWRMALPSSPRYTRHGWSGMAGAAHHGHGCGRRSTGGHGPAAWLPPQPRCRQRWHCVDRAPPCLTGDERSQRLQSLLTCRAGRLGGGADDFDFQRQLDHGADEQAAGFEDGRSSSGRGRCGGSRLWRMVSRRWGGSDRGWRARSTVLLKVMSGYCWTSRRSAERRRSWRLASLVTRLAALMVAWTEDAVKSPSGIDLGLHVGEVAAHRHGQSFTLSSRAGPRRVSNAPGT
jgi:hypothetical protein